MGRRQDTVAVLAGQYAARFRETLRPLRMIGREAEFPLVYPDGRAGDVFRLWEPLLAKGGFEARYDDPQTRTVIVALTGAGGTIEVEVGRATVELVLGPYEDLWQLAEGTHRLLRQVAEVAHEVGMRVLGFGIQPRTRPSAALMTPKRRYRYLAQAAGEAWWHFTTTASDQVHVDITRAEIADAVNTLNLLSAPLIALTANSSVYAGRPGHYLSGREGLLGALGADRAGMTPRAFVSVEEFVAYICHYPCYVLRRGGGFRPSDADRAAVRQAHQAVQGPGRVHRRGRGRPVQAGPLPVLIPARIGHTAAGGAVTAPPAFVCPEGLSRAGRGPAGCSGCA